MKTKCIEKRANKECTVHSTHDKLSTQLTHRPARRSASHTRSNSANQHPTALAFFPHSRMITVSVLLSLSVLWGVV